MSRYITELANDIAKSCPDLVENGCGNDNCVACLAFKLIGLGYQKQSEGEWTRFEVNSSKGYGQVYYQHKDCETNATQLFPSPYHFCPNCGAKMKGD